MALLLHPELQDILLRKGDNYEKMESAAVC